MEHKLWLENGFNMKIMPTFLIIVRHTLDEMPYDRDVISTIHEDHVQGVKPFVGSYILSTLPLY